MKKIITMVLGGMLVLGMQQAHSALISVTDMANQTVSGENFNFSFGGLGPSDGTGGTFVLRAAGDYDGRDDEVLSWDIEGLTGAAAVGGFCSTGITSVCSSAGGATTAGGQGGVFDSVILGQALGQIEWTRTYSLGGALLDSILADGVIDLFIDLNDNVGLFNPPNFVEVTFEYNTSSVPAPASLVLLAIGLLGLGFAGKKRAA